METLREGVEFALYRGRQPGYPNPVLVLAPVAEHPSLRTLKRLELNRLPANPG